MQGLYEKHPLAVSLACIGIYVFGMSAADALSLTLGQEKLVTLLFSALFCVALLFFVLRENLARHLGLCRAKVPPSRTLFYLPLILLSCFNLLFGVTLNLSVTESLFYVLSMFCVGFLEEVIFRGLLFRAMARDNLRAATIVSSVTFGLGHIVNLFNASGMDLAETLCQVFYATAAGFLFVLLFRRTGTLVPCILSHAFLNATSVFSVEAPNEVVSILLSLALGAACLLYALFLYKRLPDAQT